MPFQFRDLSQRDRSLHQPQIEHALAVVGITLRASVADIAALEAVDVQRRLVDQIEQTLSAAFGVGDAKLLLYLFVILRRILDRLQLRRPSGSTSSAQPLTIDVALSSFIDASSRASVIAGIRRPVAVVPAVQRPVRAVDREIDIHIAAHAKHDLLSTRLMHRPVADDERIGLEQVFVLCEYLSQVRRAGFFFALEKEFDVDGRLYAFCAFNASNAVSIANTPALSSDAERAYSRHSGSIFSPAFGNGIVLSLFSQAAVRSTGSHGSLPVHARGSVGCPS